MAAVYEAKGDAKSAEDRFARALGIYRAQRAVGLSGGLFVLKRLAGLRGEAGDHAGALAYLDEGLKALAVEPAAGGTPWKISPQSAEFLALKATTLLKSDPKSVAAKKAAHELFVTAGAITDRLRGEQRSSAEAKTNLVGGQQVEWIQTRLVLCEELARAEPGGGWAVAAFRAAEEGRARVFLEQLGRSRSGVVGDLPAALAERERRAAQDLARAQRELEAIEAAPFDRRDPGRVAALQKAVADAARAGEEVQAAIARDHPRVAALRRPYPCSVAEARAVLGKNEVAVIYCCGKATGTAVVLRPAGEPGDGIALVPLPGTDEFGDDFEVLVGETGLKVPDLYRDKAAKLYAALVKPLENVVGDRDLLVIPDGKLGLLPFETLIDGKGRFLIESRTVRMAPSMTALHLNGLWEKKRPRPARAVLAVGDPVTAATDPRLGGRELLPSARRAAAQTGGRFDRLVHSGREATAVADVFKAPAEDRWLGPDAAEGRLKAWNASGRLAEYRYLHFATHGVLGAARDVPPALVLSLVAGPPPDAEDGLLTVREVSELRLNADLVVLSACRSAHGELRTGEGITGLARGFLSAGARGVVCSLWAVDDRDTAALMTEVYEQVGRGLPAAEALRAAKLRLIRDGKRPYDWAPFVLVGGSN
jgi:CHAT domain-containing protein